MGSVSVQSHLTGGGGGGGAGQQQQPVPSGQMSSNSNSSMTPHQDPTKSVQWQISTSVAPASVSKDFNYITQTSGGGSGAGGLVSTVSTGPVQGKMPPLIREFLKSLDDQEWQSSLYTLLQNQTFNQVEVDLFELMSRS